MGRILAIDYGQKRVGLAVTDENRIIAGSLTTVSSDQVIKFLKDYLSREVVDFFVLGEPRNMANQPSESAKFVEEFAKSLSRAFPDKKIIRFDERFTSKIATLSLLQSGLKKKMRKDKALVDTVSATLILQSFLESREYLSSNLL
jgi:putative Holliday junction resolvase